VQDRAGVDPGLVPGVDRREGEYTVGRISYRETARIAETLSESLSSDLSLDRAFEILLRYRRSRAARGALSALRAAVANGSTFSDGLRIRCKAWPLYFIELVRCAERVLARTAPGPVERASASDSGCVAT